jgi:cytochrome c oxidase cbb3-type subunit 3
MTDFSNDFWSFYVALISVISIAACAVLLFVCTTRKLAPGEKANTTGHVWDGDLNEWNNPLPRWWMWLFYITIVFALAYLVLYPGLGSYGGALKWSSQHQYNDEQKRAGEVYGPLFAKYLQQDIPSVAGDPAAREIGQRLFLNHCAQCHGSDAGGSRGFPSLRDRDWLYGGDPETIKASITNGRDGAMPALGSALGGAEDVKNVAHYVMSLSGRTHDELRAAMGKPKFMAICAACHQATGRGTPALGAPNLTDEVWLYGGSEATIIETISNGRSDHMPAHKDVLDQAKIHLLTAYVYGLSVRRP